MGHFFFYFYFFVAGDDVAFVEIDGMGWAQLVRDADTGGGEVMSPGADPLAVIVIRGAGSMS